MLQIVKLLCRDLYLVKIPNCKSVIPRLHVIVGSNAGFKVNIEIYRNVFENPLLKNYSATIYRITMRKSAAIVDSKLMKS